MKSIIIKIQLIFFVVIFGFAPAHSQSPYNLKWPDERVVTLVGSGLTATGIFLHLKVPPLSHTDIKELSRENVFSFDRSATLNWSPSAAKISDVLLITHSFLPTTLLLSERIRNDNCTFGVLFLETMLFTYGINSIVKGITKRTRPFVYNENAPLSEKLKANARRSFYSGHTSFSFTGAVLTSKLFSNYFPNSDWKEVVWGTTLVGASCVGYLRYAAGKHFPSDVLVGAIMGGLTGYFVPYLLERNRKDGSSISPFQKAKIYKISIGFCF
jgi:membrane-associated phospholipid phosphatase